MSNSSNKDGREGVSSGDHSPTPIRSKKNDEISKHMKGLSIVYKECLKNHAASIGGNARDGCGEFMLTDENNLNCSACGCHRNFHRREVDVSGGGGGGEFGFGYSPQYPHYRSTNTTPMTRQDVLLQCHQSKGFLGAGCGPHELARPIATFPKVENMEENEEGVRLTVEGSDGNKKRQRTKFTAQQKEKMLEFAEKAEWKIQKLDQGTVNEFCHEVGIKRKVLNVWMHNNKQHYVKKDCTTNSTFVTHISDS